MPAYEWFPAGTTDAFIQHVRDKAQAYGWVIDFFGAYNGYNRLHLHNSDGAHFELFHNGETAYIRACTGYDPVSPPWYQPGTVIGSAFSSNKKHLIIVGQHSIFVKTYYGESWVMNFQFGCIVDKIGVWSGGFFFSTLSPSNSHELWRPAANCMSQVYINGSWSASAPSAGGAVSGEYAPSLYSRMPFAYSGGIIPVPLLLLQFDPNAPSYRHPIGYAPDARAFAGGNVYRQLEEITIDGDVWVGVNQTELNGGIDSAPDLLIRLAS